MSNLDPIMCQALSTAFALTRKVQPISASTPTRDYSNHHTIHLTTTQAAYIDNVLQDAQRLHKQLGEKLDELRHLQNTLILPGCIRGLNPMPRSGEK